MRVINKTEHDPVCDLDFPNAYMRWAIMAVEEIAGKHGTAIILREAGLERLIDNLPPANMEFEGLKYSDYSALNQALLNFFGRPAKTFARHIGRLSARYSIEQESVLFGFATTALKLMPVNMRLKIALNNMAQGFRKLAARVGQTLDLRVEELPDKFLYISYTCPVCNGRLADEPMCYVFIGTIQEGAVWLTNGQEFRVVETHCRAIGDPACVFELYKTPMGR
nr:4-vinyl reductase [Anaerolineae bacterium]